MREEEEESWTQLSKTGGILRDALPAELRFLHQIMGTPDILFLARWKLIYTI